MQQKVTSKIDVFGKVGAPEASLRVGDWSVPAMIGRSGLVAPNDQKKEGDGTTPTGSFRLRTLYYRADRLGRPRTLLPSIATESDMLWCDDPGHALYNRPVRAPFSASHEKLWLERRVYDLVVVLDYNMIRPVPGAGSAIFFHLTDDDAVPGPTEGCVAIKPAEMLALLPSLSAATVMTISEAQS